MSLNMVKSCVISHKREVYIIINLPIIMILGKTALAVLKDYSEQQKAGKDPKFKASSIGLKGETDFWN